MADELENRRQKKLVDQIIESMKGPVSEGHKVMVENRMVPKLRMLDCGDEINFILDDRLVFVFDRAAAPDAALFAANAMAIGAGYGSIGHCDCKPAFAPKAIGITRTQKDD